jgi:hypothetical protein
LGRRRNDRARVAQIELIGNDIEVYEKSEKENFKNTLGLPTFWAWERKILVQEQEYF